MECEGEVVRQMTINAAQYPVGRGKERGQLAQGSGQGKATCQQPWKPSRAGSAAWAAGSLGGRHR